MGASKIFSGYPEACDSQQPAGQISHHAGILLPESMSTKTHDSDFFPISENDRRTRHTAFDRLCPL